MIQRKKTMESKKTTNSSLRKKKLNKSISLIIKSPNFSNKTIHKKLYPYLSKISYSVQTSETKPTRTKKNNNSMNAKNFSKLCNLTLYRQNSQGTLYSLKKFNHDFLFPDMTQKNKGISVHLLSEIKSPKFIEHINNRKRKYNNNYSKNISEKYFINRYNHNKSNHNSTSSLNKKKKSNLSQKNINLRLNFDEYYDSKENKDDIVINKNNKKLKIDDEYNYDKKTQNNYNRYDKKMCVIERKIYGENKYNKNTNNKSKEKENKEKGEKSKISESDTLPRKEEKDSNKLSNRYSKYNLKRELKKLENKISNIYNFNHSNHNLTQKSKDSHNISINDLLNYKINSSKMLLNKSKTNSNILNTSLEEITKINNNINTNNNSKEHKNSRCNDIKLVFPSFFNKLDINYDSSQESTNLIGNTFSNKITINNSNMVSRKDKFINSFLDGPEDIHYRFVDLHKQRKIFYENICNKENGNQEYIKISINNNKAKISDFDKNEYSEYFDNFNEEVPII